ncbi:Voltage-gated hydrogen channel 1 [Diplonema papillatum]|nr:Voltage-gated hydrogen channel 1 [Diplonema papillatum]|eukprot:gene21189-32635_t
MVAENEDVSWDGVPRAVAPLRSPSIASSHASTLLKARIEKRRQSALQKIKINELDPSGRGRYVVRQSALKQVFFPHYAPKEYLTAMETDKARATGRPYKRSKRAKLVDFLQGKNVQLALIVLLMLDVLCVIAEIIILTHKSPVVELESRCEEAHLHLNHTDDLYFAPDGCGFTVDNELSHTLHRIEVGLLWASRGILFIFAAELITLTLCLGKHFFTPMYTLDSVVIYLSIILSFILEEDHQEEVAVIIFLRCWRFARILHGFGLTVHDVEKEAAEEEMEEVCMEALEEVDKRMSLMQAESDELRRALQEARDELHVLKKRGAPLSDSSNGTEANGPARREESRAEARPPQQMPAEPQLVSTEPFAEGDRAAIP